MFSSSYLTLSGWREGGLFVLSFGIFGLLCYRSRKQKQLDHENPRVQGVMRREAHVELGAFVSEVEARNFVLQPHCSPYVVTLDQAWQFNLYSSYHEVIAAMNMGIAHKDAMLIEVPGHWQLQTSGDTPLYTNVKYTIPVTPPHVPPNNATGYYRKHFKVSKSWQDRAIILSFGAVDSAFYLYINEVSVGFSKDSRLPAEFNISEYVHFDHENLLEVVVMKYSDGHYLEDQDMWHLSGIFREVILYSLPQPLHIGDFKWNVSVDYTMQVATVDVEVKLRWDLHTLQQLWGNESYEVSPHNSHLNSDWIVTTALYEEGQLTYSAVSSDNSHLLVFDQSKDDAICTSEDYATPPQISSTLNRSLAERTGGYITTSLNISHMIVSPALWCPEHPNVYTLVICLKNAADGSVAQAESCRVGVRTIDISDGHLRINQRSILVRGVNLHEHDPFRGHFASRRLIEADIRLMKRNNFNAVRTSHYPHSSWFYELCTLYGLYVVDEANIETHGMVPYAGRLADDSDWEAAYLQRVDRMIERDKNHACVIIWSLGNEGGYGKAHDKLAQWVRKKDPSRKVMYEPASYGPRPNLTSNNTNSAAAAANSAKNLATDILCPMYARVDDCIIMGNRYPDLPLILCEYSHMMGNSGGNLSDYWNAFLMHSRLQGGFIWDWVDQGIAVKNAHGDYIWAYGGDFGESQHDGAFCLNGLNWPDRGFGRNVLLCDLGRVMGKKKLLREQAHSYGLACPFTSKQGLKDRGLSAAAALKDDTLPVLEAMAKPQLLEAKQSMKVFQCTVTELKCREIKMEPATPTVVHNTTRGPPIAKRRPSATAEAIRITVKYSILNLMDHVTDLRDHLNFEAILLCDGLIVAATSLQLPEDRILSRKHLSYEDEDTRHSYQELEGHARFTVPVKRATTTSEVLHRYSSLPDLRASLLGRRIVRGIPWPETYLLSPLSFKDVNETIEMSNDGPAMWSVVSKFSHWSVVTIGRLADHAVWASKGFPVGFSQNSLNVNLKVNIPRTPVAFGGLRANVPMPTYRSPSDDKPRVPLLRSQSSNGESEAHEVYDVRVSWGRDSGGNCTIVLTGDLKPDVYFSTPEFPGHIEAVVSASTGYLLKYCADGVDMLATEADINDVATPPSRFQLHRAATDNDRGGYLAAWRAAGMDGMLHHVRNIVPPKLHVDGGYSPRSDADSPGQQDSGEPVMGKHTFECVSVEHIFMHGDDRDRGEGVQCTWEMAPSQLDKGKLRILNHIISFVQHGNAGTTLVEVFSNEQERFAHELAAAYMLGRKTFIGRDESFSGVYKGEKLASVKIRLMKRHTYIVTTIPAVEKLVVGPLGCLIDESLPADMTSSLDDVPVVSWNVSYIITQRGALLVRAEVDASALPCPLPRVGMQMNLKSDFHRALWFGQGPHECYPDREASVVKAVHRATIDSLPVPYIVPGENAARGSIDWLRLDYKYTPPTPSLSCSNSASDFSFSQPGTPIPPPPPYATPVVVSKFDDLQLLNVTSPMDSRRMSSLSPALTPMTNSENDTGQPVIYSMVVRCCRPFHFSTLRHTIEDLTAAQHTYELDNSIRPFVCLNVDPYIMGVGGDDSWSACVHDEFLLPPAKYSFQLALSIFRS